jgi:hypothetical protein
MKLNKLLVPTLFLFTFLFLFFNKVNSIECLLENNPCPESLVQIANSLKNSSFFFGDFEKTLRNNQNSQTIYILENLQKIFPNTLKLNFKQEQVKYAIIIEAEKQYVGESGLVLLNQQNQNAPLIIEWKNNQSILENNILDKEYHAIFLSASKSLEKLSVKNPQITWKSDEEIILKIDSLPPLIFDKQSIQTQIKKVDTIINARELDEIEAPIIEIDMRLDLPVLRTRQ